MSDKFLIPGGAEALLAKFERTSYGGLLRDSSGRRRLLAQLMAESGDSLVCEIGRQLRDGQATPQQLLSVPQYWEALQHGVAQLAETNLAEVESQVNDMLELEREASERGEHPDPHNGEAPEPHPDWTGEPGTREEGAWMS
jgi:hypothetical protein